MKYWLFLLCLCAVACGNGTGGEKFTVKGTLPDGRYDNTYIYIEKHDILSHDFPKSIDSTLIKDGAFTIIGIAAEMPAVYHLIIPAAIGPHHTLPVIIDQKKMQIDYDPQVATLRGGKIARRYNDLILSERKEIELKKDIIMAERNDKERNGKLPEAEMNLYNERLREVYLSQMPNYTQFVRENIDNPVGWYFFFNTSLERYAEKDREELYATVPDTLRSRYDEMWKSRIDKQSYFQQSQKEAVPGKPAREITGFDVSGNKVSLSDFRGKVILVDTWASWCQPCVHEFPELKELYAKYKDRGLEIIGFSVDEKEKEDAWKKAIIKYELPWINISDLKAWDSQMIADYGIQAIPFTILIDREGVIVGRNLHAHNLRAALEELFP